MVYWCLLYFKNDDTNAPEPDGTEKKNLKDTCQRFPYFENKKQAITMATLQIALKTRITQCLYFLKAP